MKLQFKLLPDIKGDITKYSSIIEGDLTKSIIQEVNLKVQYFPVIWEAMSQCTPLSSEAGSQSTINYRLRCGHIVLLRHGYEITKYCITPSLGGEVTKYLSKVNIDNILRPQ